MKVQSYCLSVFFSSHFKLPEKLILKIEKKAKDLWDFIYFIRLGNQWNIHTYIKLEGIEWTNLHSYKRMDK